MPKFVFDNLLEKNRNDSVLAVLERTNSLTDGNVDTYTSRHIYLVFGIIFFKVILGRRFGKCMSK